ncbi:hypothetical protein [Herbaspirillum sp. meg3]|uniref:hypothetical protein n=1 Tax=Herbaspirillum sp. meg3 TaxID=2025949 RepID=UPI0012FE5C55|nr:hypothetical protein [Herbaspirillum sp. meg3]
MDVDYFLKRRVDAIVQFYEEASSRFVETMGKIEKEEPPFEPVYAEDGEPQFLDEWLQQSYSLDLIGRSAISNLSNTLKIYFETWSKLLWKNPQACREAAPELFKRSFVRGYVACFAEVTGLDLVNCAADIDVIEQIILARNLDGHAGSLTSEAIRHNKSTLTKFPVPLFTDPNDMYWPRSNIENDPFGFGGPALHVSAHAFRHAAEQVRVLSNWLEEPLRKFKYGGGRTQSTDE